MSRQPGLYSETGAGNGDSLGDILPLKAPRLRAEEDPWPQGCKKKRSADSAAILWRPSRLMGRPTLLQPRLWLRFFAPQVQMPQFWSRFFSANSDVRHDADVEQQIIHLLRTHAVRTVALADRIMGCPHEEGIDYPEGKSCPQCPFWAGRDRWTGDRIH